MSEVNGLFGNVKEGKANEEGFEEGVEEVLMRLGAFLGKNGK
ncbi:hypothetical protein [Neisseria sicca]|nr:hypothetical protein [Neisseria sicca]